MKTVFALVDCNNFFVSCERVFAPHLEGKAVVVLSNNDGCAIARSNEAKALGIAMGAPFYQFRNLYEEKKLEVFSSNFELYSDMSWRVMTSLQMLCPNIEIYSVDEAFLAIQNMALDDYTAFGENIRQKIRQWTGIPVSVGIASSKTLAKIANHLAKKTSKVCNLLNHPQIDEILEQFPVEEIWGIGRKSSIKLRIMGIGTALELRNADPKFIRKHFTVGGERMVYELQGVSCLDLTEVHKAKVGITSSRSFGGPVTEIEDLEEALSNYVSTACVKLRKQTSRAQNICVYLRTNHFRKDSAQYSNSIMLALPHPSSDTSEIIELAKKGLKQIFKPEYQYHKLGIMLLDLQSAKYEQKQLFDNHDYKKSDKLMGVLDATNRKIGKNTLFFAAQGTERHWQMQSRKRSPQYTTNWKELLRVK